MGETVKRSLGILAMAVAAGALILIAICMRKNGSAEGGVTLRDFAMGSAVTITLYGEQEQLEDTAGTVMEKIRRLDEEVISRRVEGSELSNWNRNAKAGEKVPISSTLSRALDGSELIWEYADHVLDLTLRPVLDTWGIEDKDPSSFQVPSEEELREAAGHTGMDKITRGDGLARSSEDVTLDLGAVGKGYALDIAYDYLILGEHSKPAYDANEFRNGRSSRVTGGVIAVGGSVMVFGSKADGSDFKVGVRDPEGQPEDVIGTISVPSGYGRTCVSTSGGYEKYIEKDGVRYHHIIDPRTMHPADSGLKSVTVVCTGEQAAGWEGLVSDGLSTACFILGEKASLPILSSLNAEAVMIREDGSIYVTDGLKDAWQETR